MGDAHTGDRLLPSNFWTSSNDDATSSRITDPAESTRAHSKYTRDQHPRVPIPPSEGAAYADGDLVDRLPTSV